MIYFLIKIWMTASAWGWGDLGHRVIVEYGTELAKQQVLQNCHLTSGQLVSHTNDPDKIWRQQRREHPNEGEAHFFHIDRQPKNWREQQKQFDLKQGYLTYRILEWIDLARKEKQTENWDKLAQLLYGLSHYVGDLSQPLHLHHDHDGEEAGLPDIHSQFETKMLNRYESEVRFGVKQRLEHEKIPSLWTGLDLKTLIFNIAEQSYTKTPRLFTSARLALQMPLVSRKRARSQKHPPQPRFIKKILWEHTGSLAMDQLALSSRLWAHVLNSICFK